MNAFGAFVNTIPAFVNTIPAFVNAFGAFVNVIPAFWRFLGAARAYRLCLRRACRYRGSGCGLLCVRLWAWDIGGCHTRVSSGEYTANLYQIWIVGLRG